MEDLPASNKFDSLTDEEAAELLWRKEIGFGIRNAGLASATRHFHNYRDSVEQERSDINTLRARFYIEPLPNDTYLEVREKLEGVELTRDLLERERAELELNLREVFGVADAISERLRSIDSRLFKISLIETQSGSQKTQDFVDEEGGPDQGL